MNKQMECVGREKILIMKGRKVKRFFIQPQRGTKEALSFPVLTTDQISMFLT